MSEKNRIPKTPEERLLGALRVARYQMKQANETLVRAKKLVDQAQHDVGEAVDALDMELRDWR